MKNLIIGLIVGMFFSFSITVGAFGDSIEIFVDNEKIESDVEPQIIDGRTMVPIRFVAEALDAEVEWDGDNNEVIISTKSEPEPEPEPEPESEDIGTKSNPVSINEGVRIGYTCWLDGEVVLVVQLLEVIRGEEAWNTARRANRFNSEPDPGKEYMLAKFHVYTEYLEEEPYDINHAKFDLVSEDGITYEDFFTLSGLEPDLNVDLYEGATHEGYTYFMVDKDDENPLIALNRGRDYELWFDPMKR